MYDIFVNLCSDTTDFYFWLNFNYFILDHKLCRINYYKQWDISTFFFGHRLDYFHFWPLKEYSFNSVCLYKHAVAHPCTLADAIFCLKIFCNLADIILSKPAIIPFYEVEYFSFFKNFFLLIHAQKTSSRTRSMDLKYWEAIQKKIGVEKVMKNVNMVL